jgi:hypothetical protein
MGSILEQSVSQQSPLALSLCRLGTKHRQQARDLATTATTDTDIRYKLREGLSSGLSYSFLFLCRQCRGRYKDRVLDESFLLAPLNLKSLVRFPSRVSDRQVQTYLPRGVPPLPLSTPYFSQARERETSARRGRSSFRPFYRPAYTTPYSAKNPGSYGSGHVSRNHHPGGQATGPAAPSRWLSSAKPQASLR